eukprot:NODE_102_length_20354_cov_0.272018.p6 type:complete len:251 gc:universal NODE_102_length_20354_cov_0.272018:18317-19069(+)
MSIDESNLEFWIAQFAANVRFNIYWDVQSKIKLDFIPFYVHEYPTIVFLSNINSIKHSYCSLHDGLFANKTEKDANLLIVPCKTEAAARLMVLKVIGKLSATKHVFYFYTPECELSNNLVKLKDYGQFECKVINRHLHNNLRNSRKKQYDTLYTAVFEALLCFSSKNRHPVISKAEYQNLFNSIPNHAAIFNHLLEDFKLVADKSLKLSKAFGLKEYDDEFTYQIIGKSGKLTPEQIELLGADVVKLVLY